MLHVEKLIIWAAILFVLVAIWSFVWSALHHNFKEDLTQNLIILAVGPLILLVAYVGNKLKS